MDCVSIIDQPNKTFCMAPWIHLHSWANGTVYPCCVSNSSPEHAYGNLRTNSLKDLYNSEKIKQLRRNMMNDVATDTCQKCYDQETIGIRSVRQNMNIDYLNNYRHLVELTDEYGFVTPDNIQLPYLDLRFSNICNLKCRTCSLDFSSKWYEDELKLQGRDISDTRIIKIRENTESIFSELDPLIPNIKKIYFAGGEPLIMQEHWTFLEKIQQQNCNHIELFYQTNLTQLKYKNKNIFDIWNHFDSVNVSASLDASHSLAEYIRSGTVWKEVENNIRSINDQCNHIKFTVSCTVSALNVHNVVEFYNYLTDNKFIEPDMFELNPVYYPQWYGVSILPQKLIDKYKNKIDEFISQTSLNNKTTQHFRSLSSLLNVKSKYGSEDWYKFVNLTNKLDDIRGEKLESVHNELSEYIK